MNDFIEAKLKQFERAIDELPIRYRSTKTEEETVHSIDDLFEFSLDQGKSLLNDFMSYVVQIDRIEENEFTHGQIEQIMMIDLSFELYFGNNIIVERTNRGANSNAITDHQKMDQLIEGLSHAFGASLDPNYAKNIQSEYKAIKRSMTDYKAYKAIYNQLNEIYKTEIAPLPDDITMMLKQLRADVASKDNSSTPYPGINITLPKTNSPKKP